MGMLMKNGIPYASGSNLPEGGTKGQVLVKASDLDGDVEWGNAVGGGGSGNSGSSGETPTLDAVLKKGNETDNSARFTGTDSSTEISNSGAYMAGIGTEGMRQFSISQDRISAVDNLVGTVTPKFVVPFEPSGEDQVAMSDAVKESFMTALDAQDKLVSGTNIKTVAGESILGSGDIPIPVIMGSGWGVAKVGSVNINANTTPTTVDISDLRLSSVDDYQVAVSVSSSEATGNYKVVVVKTNKDSFTITPSAHVFTVNYTVFAKGYGGVPNGGTTGQVLAKKSDADGDTEWVTGGGSINVDTEMSDTSENAVQNKVAKAYIDSANAELHKQKATGYFERTDYPITLDTVGQPYYALARDSFKIEIENHKPYTYEFTASDVFDLTTRYNETVGKSFTTMNEDNETIWITMKGALPDNVQYVVGTTTPVVDLTNATITLTKTTFIQQIDDMLIPKSSGEVFVFDVDSEQFTEDPDNPGGKHIGTTITSPTFDEIMDNLVSGKIVFARMLSNGGNSYDFYQLSRESQQGIRGKAFDLEFPQGHIWFYDIYVKKRGLGTNTTTYFGVFYDKVVDGGGSGTSEVPTIDQVIAKGDTTTRSIAFNNENGNDANSIDYSGLSLSGVATEGLRQVQYSQHGIKAIDNLAGTMTDIFSVDFDNKEVAMSDDIKNAFMTALGAQSATEFAEAVGDTSALSTTATDLSAAVNELKSGIDALGEPFRVKQWGTNTLNVEIPYCTEDIANANIPKMVFSIDDTEGADYQIVGMIAYEVFDAASGGNRINCFPVCQFTGNGQKELSVRWTCMGTTRKTAKRINAWVLLKHR